MLVVWAYLRDNTAHSDIKEHMQPYYRRLDESRKLATGVPVEARPDAVISQCGGACPTADCALLAPIDAFLREHATVLDRDFPKAVKGGFGDLWEFGARIANAVWPDGSRDLDGPGCAVMVAAARVGMTERDILVLRGNMIRLRDSRQQEGGRQ